MLWASIALGAIVGAAMRGHQIPGSSGWFAIFSTIETGPVEIARNLLAFSTSINPSMWSIQVELVMIVVLPFLAPILLRARGLNVLVGAIALSGVSDGLLLPLSFRRPELRIVAYIYCFYLGLIVPRICEVRTLIPFIKNGWAIAAELAALITIFLLCQRGLFSPATMFVTDAFVSVHIVCYLVYSQAKARWLLHPRLVWLGDISYSFYAYGQIVLAACAFFLFTHLPNGWWVNHPNFFTVGAALLSLVVLSPLAALSFQWIEKPGMLLGRRWLARPAVLNASTDGG